MTRSWYRWQGNALIVQIAVQPGAKRSEFVGLHGNALKIRLQAPPVDGKANRCLIEFLAEQFATQRAQVELVSGATGRNKTVRITAPQRIPAAVAEQLQAATVK